MSASRMDHPSGAPRRSEALGRAVLNGIAWTAGLLAPPAARLALAIPFLKSGLTKWSGWCPI